VVFTAVLSLFVVFGVVTDTGPGTRTLPLAAVLSIVAAIFVSMPVGAVLGTLGAVPGSRRATPRGGFIGSTPAWPPSPAARPRPARHPRARRAGTPAAPILPSSTRRNAAGLWPG